MLNLTKVPTTSVPRRASLTLQTSLRFRAASLTVAHRIYHIASVSHNASLTLQRSHGLEEASMTPRRAHIHRFSLPPLSGLSIFHVRLIRPSPSLSNILCTLSVSDPSPLHSPAPSCRFEQHAPAVFPPPLQVSPRITYLFSSTARPFTVTISSPSSKASC